MLTSLNKPISRARSLNLNCLLFNGACKLSDVFRNTCVFVVMKFLILVQLLKRMSIFYRFSILNDAFDSTAGVLLNKPCLSTSR